VFRPASQHSWLGYLPLRLAAAVFGLVVLLVAAAVFVGVQYERSRQVWPAGDGAPGPGAWLALGASDALKVVAMLLILAAVGIFFFMTVLNYRAVTHTVERVKSLMRNVLESIPTGVLTLDARGLVTSLNGAGERLLELRASAVVGRAVDDVLQAVPALATWIQGALRGERLVQETDLTLAVDGARRVTVRASASELRDEAGRPDGLVVLLRDITEVNRLETQLRRADKLAALGTLAAGVAHEVKNPLQALGLNLHLLEAEVRAPSPPSAVAGEYFAILRSELLRIHRIVENFLRFSKPSLPEVKPVDLNALLERVLSLLAFEAADHGVTIETAFDPDLVAVPGDEGQLAQVFLNIGINALQAMRSGGSLNVTTRRQDGWAEVSVEDSGEGIREEILPHIFDPYFTTRPHGVGLGLVIAHRIVEGHQGTTDVESEVGKGTTMVVRLPLAGRAPDREER
jgi:PAS domain S-box-containing protein